MADNESAQAKPAPGVPLTSETARDIGAKGLEVQRAQANPDKAAMRTILAAIRRGDARIALSWLIETGAIKRMSKPAQGDDGVSAAIAQLLGGAAPDAQPHPSTHEGRGESNSDIHSPTKFPEPPSYPSEPARVKPNASDVAPGPSVVDDLTRKAAANGCAPPRMRRRVKKVKSE